MYNPNPQEEAIVARLDLEEAMRCLTERERTILRLRYWHGWTQKEVAQALGIGQSGLCRLESRALAKLRHAMLLAKHNAGVDRNIMRD
jgi:RNA polymerase sigma factor (sigma-70 family)